MQRIVLVLPTMESHFFFPLLFSPSYSHKLRPFAAHSLITPEYWPWAKSQTCGHLRKCRVRYPHSYPSVVSALCLCAQKASKKKKFLPSRNLVSTSTKLEDAHSSMRRGRTLAFTQARSIGFRLKCPRHRGRSLSRKRTRTPSCLICLTPFSF